MNTINVSRKIETRAVLKGFLTHSDKRWFVTRMFTNEFHAGIALLEDTEIKNWMVSLFPNSVRFSKAMLLEFVAAVCTPSTIDPTQQRAARRRLFEATRGPMGRHDITEEVVLGMLAIAFFLRFFNRSHLPTSDI